MSEDKWYLRRPTPEQLRARRRWAIPMMLIGVVLIAISMFIVFG